MVTFFYAGGSDDWRSDNRRCTVIYAESHPADWATSCLCILQPGGLIHLRFSSRKNGISFLNMCRDFGFSLSSQLSLLTMLRLRRQAVVINLRDDSCIKVTRVNSVNFCSELWTLAEVRRATFSGTKVRRHMTKRSNCYLYVAVERRGLILRSVLGKAKACCFFVRYVCWRVVRNRSKRQQQNVWF